MPDDPFVVSLYIRVSTDQQAKEGDSLEEQESELKKFCDYRNYTIHHIFIERGKSGGNTNRPEYQRLIQDVKNKKIQAVVVKKIDRLSRSLLDFEAFMKLLQEKDIEFISIKENFDTTSAMGKAMLRVALVFAQLEREQTSERLIDVLEYRASQGLYNGGHRPYGYTVINKEIIPYPKEKEVVELIFNQFIENKSTTITARYLNDNHFRNRKARLWDCRHVQKILQHPVYIGKVRWNNQIHQGIHLPIISDSQFRQVQRIFSQRTQLRSDSKALSLLQRLLKCGFCNSPMTPSHSINSKHQKYFYYRCTSTQNPEKNHCRNRTKQIAMTKIEKAVIDLISSLASDVRLATLESPILKHNDTINQEIQLITADLQRIDLQLTTLKAKKEQYLDSLILGNFSAKEREVINTHIEAMNLEEKQLTSTRLKQEFERNQKTDHLINLTAIKTDFIQFRADHETLSPTALRDRLKALIDTIHYTPTAMAIEFKNIPFKLEFPCEL